jgi:hypothetical protein
MSEEDHVKHRLKVYDDAPFKHVPSKHWTDLPREEREKYVASHPKTQLKVQALLCLLIWAPSAAIVWLDPDLSEVGPPKSAIIIALSAYLGWIVIIYLLLKAYRTK